MDQYYKALLGQHGLLHVDGVLVIFFLSGQ